METNDKRSRLTCSQICLFNAFLIQHSASIAKLEESIIILDLAASFFQNMNSFLEHTDLLMASNATFQIFENVLLEIITLIK